MKNPFPGSINHIGIISPSGPINKETVLDTCKLLRKFGIKITVMPHVHGSSKVEYLAADIADRLDDLHNCWKNRSINLVLAARGGYGSAQLLPYIDWDLLKSRDLPLLGYSDITALHLAMLAKNAGVPVASPMIRQLPKALGDGFSDKWLTKALSTDTAPEKLVLCNKAKLRIIKKGTASAPVIPVNLTMLNSLLGTSYIPDLTGKILLIEDVKEPTYKLDRCLTQLRLAGIPGKLAALLIGDFRYCGNSRQREELFVDFATSVNGPVISGLPFGHRLPMLCLRYGSIIHITSNAELKIS